MNDDENKINKLSSEISDGKNIDWDDYDKTEQKPLIDKLSVINKIANFFKNTHSDENDNSNHEILFEWGHLQVKELIGEGSYGEVYKAYDPVLDRNVALKLIKEKNSAPYQSRAFIQEAKNLARVRNRHVLAIHGVNVNDSRVGIWSDLIKGKNLSNLHDENYRYDFAELLHISQSITEALIAVHESGLIHGDIKAANVMQDDKGKIILMDFGTGSDASDYSDNIDYITGTPMLMAPELIAGESKTQSCDIYSLGVLLFKLATGSYPVKGINIADIHKAHKDKVYFSFKDFQVNIPRNMKSLIISMMSYNSTNRPTAVELKQKIDHIISAPQRRLKRMVVSLIASILILGTIFSTMGFYKANQAKIIAVQEKNKAQASSKFLSDLLASPSSTGKGKDVKVADLLDVASKELSANTILQPEVKAAVLYALGQSYLALQLPDDAQIQYQESLKYYRQLYGSQSIESLKVMIGLLTVSDMKGNDESGLEIANKILSISKELGGDSLYQEKIAQIWLANYLSQTGEHQQGLKILDDIYDDMNNNNDIKYQIFRTMSNIYFNQSNYVKAQEYAQKALQWLEQYSPKLNSLIVIKNRIFLALSKQGKLEEARLLQFDITKLSEQLYGKNNIGYLTALINYGAILQETNKLNESLPILQEALQLSLVIQGRRHDVTMKVKVNLANTLVSLDRLEEGEELMQSALADGLQTLGESNVSILMLEYNLAELLNNTSRFIEAEKLAKINFNKMRNKFGEQHLFTLLSQDNIANSLMAQNKLNAADEIYAKIFKSIVKSQSIKSPYSQLILSHYIDNLIKMNQTTEAKEKLNQLYQAQVETLGQDHADTLKSKKLLKSL